MDKEGIRVEDKEAGGKVEADVDEKSMKEKRVLDDGEEAINEEVFLLGPIKIEHPLDRYDDKSNYFEIQSAKLELAVANQKPVLPSMQEKVNDESGIQLTDEGSKLQVTLYHIEPATEPKTRNISSSRFEHVLNTVSPPNVTQAEHEPTNANNKPQICLERQIFGSEQYPETPIQTRTAEKSYICTECSAAFFKLLNLKTHMRTHSGEKPHVCKECNAAFSVSASLKKHTRTHTGERPYVCTECNAAFAQSGTLKSHTRTHTGEKPYVCLDCNAAFSRSSILKNHTRTHTGKKAYVCTECNAAFF